MDDSERRDPATPDPTALTTEQLHREVASLQQLVSAEIRHLSELTDTKFEAVGSRLNDLAERTAEQKADTREAVSAALAAAKEAFNQQVANNDRTNNKSEAAITKQVDGLYAMIQTIKTGFDDKFDDLKSRMDRNEAAQTGGQGAVTEQRDASAAQRAWLVFGMTAVLFVITVAGFLIATKTGQASG